MKIYATEAEFVSQIVMKGHKVPVKEVVIGIKGDVLAEKWG